MSDAGDETEAWVLAAEYHRRCDEYDRQVCTGTRHGDPFPITDNERRLVNLNAREVKQDMLSDYCRPDMTEFHDKLQAAICEVSQLRDRTRRNPPPAEWYEGDEDCPFVEDGE